MIPQYTISSPNSLTAAPPVKVVFPTVVLVTGVLAPTLVDEDRVTSGREDVDKADVTAG